MARQQDVEYALEMLHQHRPIHNFEEMGKSEMGLFAVIRYLYMKENAMDTQCTSSAKGNSVDMPCISNAKDNSVTKQCAPSDSVARGATSKEISDAMGVSSARMTVMLKKLAQKNLITKTSSPTDARAVVITLTEQGISCAQQMRQRMYRTMERIVDEFGMEQLQILFKSVARIHVILEESRPLHWEESEAENA